MHEAWKLFEVNMSNNITLYVGERICLNIVYLHGRKSFQQLSGVRLQCFGTKATTWHATVCFVVLLFVYLFVCLFVLMF